MSLDELVLRFKKKDASAFERLYEMYSQSIQGVIANVVRDEARAKEICQDVFMKVWEKSDMYDNSKGRFFTWILNIARNAAIDETRSKHFKEQKRNLTTESFVGRLEAQDSTYSEEHFNILNRMVKGLKKKCLQIIEMLYYKGFTQKEVSEELDIPLGTVKTRNRACIGKLRENLNDNDGRS
ncbi:RNA polymerase sigma factor [Aegicerativicinus sediminis]|uniref:RNA polymerase sigma factor n=1 Tax=Aegicerativicinus sediminis TaxID=2893202 RepID=UPI001E33B795|nr:sigma-70 family RNA polymerase sigma factor [Aegicerativicinus sediminis]